MPETMTHTAFEQRLQACHGDKIVAVGQYRSSAYKLNVRCNVCQHEWAANTRPLIRGTGCPNCQWNRPQSTAEHVADILRLFGKQVTVISSTTQWGLYRCRCGQEFERRMCDMLRSRGMCETCRVGLRAADWEDAQQFRHRVTAATNRNYVLYRDLINPRGYQRSQFGWNVDHILSVYDAYMNPKGLKQPISVEECSHPANLRMLDFKLNIAKGRHSHMTATELRKRIREFDRLYGKAW